MSRNPCHVSFFLFCNPQVIFLKSFNYFYSCIYSAVAFPFLMELQRVKQIQMESNASHVKSTEITNKSCFIHLGIQVPSLRFLTNQKLSHWKVIKKRKSWFTALYKHTAHRKEIHFSFIIVCFNPVKSESSRNPVLKPSLSSEYK